MAECPIDNPLDPTGGLFERTLGPYGRARSNPAMVQAGQPPWGRRLAVSASPTRVEKPWGYELIWAATGAYVGKILHIHRGHRLSLQYHEKKVETFLLYSGRMTLIIEDDQGRLSE